MNLRRILRSLAALALGVAWIPTASAIPQSVTYTGELMASNGLPYTGSVDIVARLYTQASGGSFIWSQDIGTVAVMGGVLQAELMGDAALWQQLYAHDALYLEFIVDGETLSPRQALSTTPFAAVAGNAQKLGGMTSAQLMEGILAASVIEPADLPPNGIGAVSNGALSNMFEDVSHLWNQITAIPDFDANAVPPATYAQASVLTGEAEDSYMYEFTAHTKFTLTAESTIRMVLIPPSGTGIAPVTLIDAVELPPATYEANWTPTNTPALAGLLGQRAAGPWVLTVTDLDNTLTGASPVGTLQLFEILYSTVREDHIAMNGRLDVAGDLNVAGTVTVEEAFITPALPVTVYRYEAGSSSVAFGQDWSSVHGNAQISFVLDRPKVVQFNMQLGGDCQGANYVGAMLKLNNQALHGTTNIDTCGTYFNLDAQRTQLLDAGSYTVGIYTNYSGGSPISYHDNWRTRYLEVVIFGSN